MKIGNGIMKTVLDYDCLGNASEAIVVGMDTHQEHFCTRGCYDEPGRWYCPELGYAFFVAS